MQTKNMEKKLSHLIELLQGSNSVGKLIAQHPILCDFNARYIIWM